MKDNEILTIKEFATAAGVSPQAVYQRLTKSLQPYVVEINGKKHLKREALELFEGAEQKAENKAVPNIIKETISFFDENNEGSVRALIIFLCKHKEKNRFLHKKHYC